MLFRNYTLRLKFGYYDIRNITEKINIKVID
ncbi:hypothetical protein EcWSU1_00081 [Enterobacter ludwigii]|uniref:Uncharacterized protein n=1 Tax=Enterobacter ludwigii TaxID=299767 RepID=G8LFN6_9ENTR|nr:hypothetical protein EcWSU1_00081 [Enterobacter ludwigii]